MHRRAFWEQAVEDIGEGESTGVAAKRLGVKRETLSWWKWRLKTEIGAVPQFIPVVVGKGSRGDESAAGGVPSRMLEVEVAGGVTVRVPVGADVEYVAEMVMALRRSC